MIFSSELAFYLLGNDVGGMNALLKQFRLDAVQMHRIAIVEIVHLTLARIRDQGRNCFAIGVSDRPGYASWSLDLPRQILRVVRSEPAP